MTNFIKTQASFALGVVSPEFFLRDNINGLSELENMDVTAGGGITRRAGLSRVVNLSRGMRLISFTADNGKSYLLVLGGGHLYVYSDTTLVQDLTMPWSDNDIAQLQYAQRFGTMIFVHPDYVPRILHKSNNAFSLKEFSFSYNSDLSLNLPFMRFDDSDGITITISANSQGSNYATLTTNKDFWTANSVGVLLYMQNAQWQITAYTNARNVVAYTNNGYSVPASPVSDWSESAFSVRRGWPCSITFHQDRLVFGGSRSYPAGIWMSRIGMHNNFNVGTGLDDEAIFVTLMSGARQQIATVVSSDNLQILTNVGEWAITSKPLTPASVDIKQHTTVGSITARYLPPQQVEGATVFISAGGRDIRELTLDDLSETYNATDLCAFAKHLMQNPIDIAYNDDTHCLYVVMADGTMAVLHQNTALGISAWTLYTTNGQFKSVAVVNDITYVIVQRDNYLCIEKFDDYALCDADNNNFSVVAKSLPLRISSHNVRGLRVRKICARVMNTKSIMINDMRATLPNNSLSDTSSGFSGDIAMNIIGTVHNNLIEYMWKISCNDAKPITVMSVTVYGHYTI